MAKSFWLLLVFFSLARVVQAENDCHLSQHQIKRLSDPKPTYRKTKLIPSSNLQKRNAVTYSFSGGRLGDNLLAYLHAKWIAYKYKLPFLYRPFEFSDQFKLDKMDQPYDASQFSFTNEVTISDENQIHTDPASTLFVVPYFPECLLEYEMINLDWLPYFEVDWHDPTFHEEVVQSLTLKKNISTPKLPHDRITVAIHVRRGGGVDNYAQASVIYPLKFPPDSFYIEQLERIAKMYKGSKLYVFIFTDDLNPKAIVKEYERALNNRLIKFDCRAKHNGPKANILEDFFFMTKFDCLIRSESNFSLVASKLGNYKVAIHPKSCKYENGQIVIDQVETELDDRSGN